MSGEKFTTIIPTLSVLYDESSNMWENNVFYNRAYLKMQQAYFNDRLRRLGGVIMLSEVLDSLGLERTPGSLVSGWVYEFDGDNYIDFGLREYVSMDDHEPSIMLNFNADSIFK